MRSQYEGGSTGKSTGSKTVVVPPESTAAASWTETKEAAKPAEVKKAEEPAKKDDVKVDESQIKTIGNVKYRPFTEEERAKEALENDDLA